MRETKRIPESSANRRDNLFPLLARGCFAPCGRLKKTRDRTPARTSQRDEAHMSESDRILVTHGNGIKRITINDPEALNAVDRSMAERFFELVQEAATDDSRVVIITGAGKAFCSGANVKKMRSHTGGFSDVTDFLQRVTNPTIRALREMPKPVIARIPGVAAGVGCSYALACDIRIASTNARFGLVFSRIGLSRAPSGPASRCLFRSAVAAGRYPRCRPRGRTRRPGQQRLRTCRSSPGKTLWVPRRGPCLSQARWTTTP